VWLEACFQLIVFSCSMVAAFLLRFDFSVPPAFISVMWTAAGAFGAGKLIVFTAMGLHRRWWRYVSSHDLLRLVGANIGGSVCGALLLSVTGAEGMPRSVYALDWFVCLFFTTLIRLSARMMADVLAMRANGRDGKFALIYGAGDAGVMLAKEMRQNNTLPYSLLGFIDDDPKKQGARIQGVRVYDSGEGLTRLMRERTVEIIFIAVPSASSTQMRGILDRCSRLQVNYKIVPALAEMIAERGLLGQIRDVAVEDLLGRQPARLDVASIREKIGGKVVLVTGAAGSIGSELCRQIARFEPSFLVGYEIGETPLFFLDREMGASGTPTRFVPEIGCVQDRQRLAEVFSKHKPEMVFHAAAYKHVPMMEGHIFEAVKNNIFGTYAVASCAREHGVREFVMVSTDKAVRPTNIMGVTKRVAELLVRSLQDGGTNFVSVRFGNVLGSNGSVIPIFKEQIAAGGPVTVTHPEMTRYFMTIPEAAQLVLQAATIGQGGEIFVLDMGDPVRIVELARNLIVLSGLRPGEDIAIEYSGLRPGEKLFEELHLSDEEFLPTKHEKIKAFAGKSLEQAEATILLETLGEICVTRDVGKLILTLKRVVPDYNPSPEVLERMLVRQIRGEKPFAEQLREASSAEEAWEVVQKGAREMGFSRAAVSLARLRTEARLRDEVSGAEWTAELPLRNGDWLRLSRPFDSTVHQSAMAPFLDTLRGTLMEKSNQWDGEKWRAAGA